MIKHKKVGQNYCQLPTCDVPFTLGMTPIGPVKIAAPNTAPGYGSVLWVCKKHVMASINGTDKAQTDKFLPKAVKKLFDNDTDKVIAKNMIAENVIAENVNFGEEDEIDLEIFREENFDFNSVEDDEQEFKTNTIEDFSSPKDEGNENIYTRHDISDASNADDEVFGDEDELKGSSDEM